MGYNFKAVLVYADRLKVDLNHLLKVTAGSIRIAYIFHYKNVHDPHYHIILDFGKDVSVKVVSCLFNIRDNWIRDLPYNNWNMIKRYLSRDCDYSKNDIVSNFDLSIF